MSSRPRGRAVLALLVLVAMLACTSEQPAPAPTPAPEPSVAPTGPAGLRAGIVLPPASGPNDPQSAQLAAAMRPLQSMLPDEVTQLRPVTPDGPEFVGDLARLLVDRGTELVCLVGADVIRVANQLASRHPERTFCAVPGAGVERPENVRVVDVRFEELGHVAGAAAAGAVDDGPVALVVAPDRLGTQRFRAGVRAGVGDTVLLEWFPQSAEAARTAVEEAIAAEARVLILDVGWQPSELLATAHEAGLLLAGPMTALAGRQFEASSVLAWTIRWELVLGPVVARFADDETDVRDSVGLADDVFVVTVGAGADRGALDTVITELRDGRRDAAPGAVPPPATADEDPGASDRDAGREGTGDPPVEDDDDGA
ncbi:hypothetical protein [Egicoccus sp. AB-alg6-2]|uniref:hypothetical protein n=1 Tax=Egicoccus sp. AB-alg6-2 TaxID=3242692 RepID=UPI00359E5C06